MTPLRTVAVTGASGFVGGYVVEALNAAARVVISLGRGDRGPRGAEHRQTDYAPGSLRKALEGVDAVIHLAGRRMTREDDPTDPSPFFQPNVMVLKDLVDAANAVGAKRFVFASTIAVYTPAGGAPYREDVPPRPLNAYGLSKLTAEHYLDALTQKGGLKALALRFSAIYGAGEKGSPALMSFVNQARAGKPLNITGDPNYQIDELYVRDAAAAAVKALDAEATGVVNIGSGVGSRLIDIAETANEVFGNAGNLVVTGKAASSPVCRRMAIDRATAKLDWSPAYNLREGLLDFKRTSDHAPPSAKT